MSLRDRILSDINIYAAIHALPNTLKEKGIRGLSGLSTLIPKNYWGNRISTNGNEIYKPWAPAYTSFIQETINKAKKYKNIGSIITKSTLTSKISFLLSILVGYQIP